MCTDRGVYYSLVDLGQESLHLLRRLRPRMRSDSLDGRYDLFLDALRVGPVLLLDEDIERLLLPSPIFNI